MRSTDYISKGTAVARLYKAREYLLMDKDCRKGLCFYLRSVDILDYLEEIGIWNLRLGGWLIFRDGMFSFMRRMVGELGEYWGKIGLRIYLGVFCRYRPGMVNLFWASLCEHVWCVDVGYPLIRGAKISWYSKGRTVPLNLTFRNKK